MNLRPPAGLIPRRGKGSGALPPYPPETPEQLSEVFSNKNKIKGNKNEYRKNNFRK